VKLGLNPDDVAKVVNTGTGSSFASAFFLPRILRGDFSSGCSMQAAFKDLVAAAEISTNHGIPLPVLAAATATYQHALLRGYGDHDKGGMIRVFEDLLDLKFRSPAGGAVHG
jgi:3-hydroxyisobutyrate dehydrogenase-like beta-hydroxyacid dehydrogenase